MILYIKYFNNWSIYTFYEKEKENTINIKLHDYLISKSKLTNQKYFYIWRDYYAYKKSIKLANQYYTNKIIEKYIIKLYLWKNQEQNKRIYYKECFNKIYHTHNGHLLHSIIKKWREYIIYQKKEKLIDLIYNNSIKRKCFTNWKDYTDKKHRYHQYNEKINQVIQKRHLYYILLNSFIVWRSIIEKKKYLENQLTVFKNMKKHKIMMRLYIYTKLKQSTRNLKNTATEIYECNLKSKLFRNWRYYANIMNKSNKLNSKIYNKILHSIISKWDDYTKTKKRYRIYYNGITKKINNKHQYFTKLTIFNIWKSFSYNKKLKRVAIDYYDMKLKHDMYYKWLKYYINKYNKRKGDDQFSLYNKHKVLLKLNEYAIIHKTKRLFYEKIYNIILSNHNSNIKTSLFKYWKKITELRRKQNEIVKLRYMYKLYRTTFINWRDITFKEINKEKDYNIIADNYYKHHGLYHLLDYWSNYRINRKKYQINLKKSLYYYNNKLLKKMIRKWIIYYRKDKKLKEIYEIIYDV